MTYVIYKFFKRVERFLTDKKKKIFLFSEELKKVRKAKRKNVNEKL